MMKYSIACLLIACSTISVSWSVPAPKYLSIPHWQACVQTVTKGTANFICLPEEKAANCPSASWEALTNDKLIERCPSR